MKSCTPLSHISLIIGKAECFFLCLFLTFAASFIFFMFWVFFHALVSFDFSFCSEKVHYRLSSHIPPICDCVFNEHCSDINWILICSGKTVFNPQSTLGTLFKSLVLHGALPGTVWWPRGVGWRWEGGRR